jgi:hypothetical protein
MRGLAKPFAFVLLLLLVAIEVFAVIKYGRIIWGTEEYDKVGPLLQGVLTPLVAVITVLVSYLLIDVQFSKNRELEKEKQQLGEVYKRESDAYFKIWNAVSVSYRLLSELQRGTFDPDSKSTIEKAFTDAEPYAFVLREVHRDRFYDYWQEIVELIAKAQITPNGAPKQNLWRTHVAAIGTAFSEIQEVFRREYLGR